jgi:hypothetical protein
MLGLRQFSSGTDREENANVALGTDSPSPRTTGNELNATCTKTRACQLIH